ncbi:hypothetical protein SRB5_45240 [Streptomyces sp. RB5]|uniref:Uncharacterized protein n=1 Tax=Streptomyces smaragdinus TaxID=2585196 RepID=A0A7K0CLJ3_9ACTN|nr:hypothetical protein [Streptomyces smaragdinus]MQY14358.1 hypothetical protein [Streptomyces smaragdinus]
MNLEERLAELAAEGRRSAVPLAAERIRVRGDRRRRRKRAAAASGGVVMAAAVVVGVLSVVRMPEGATTAAKPTVTPSASAFVTPVPGPGEEYASELGFVYDAVVRGKSVQVTVAEVRYRKGVFRRSGMVHTVTLPPEIPVEAKNATGGRAQDLRMGDFVNLLKGGPEWVFALDYDAEGRVRSLREAYWLTVE